MTSFRRQTTRDLLESAVEREVASSDTVRFQADMRESGDNVATVVKNLVATPEFTLTVQPNIKPESHPLIALLRDKRVEVTIRLLADLPPASLCGVCHRNVKPQEQRSIEAMRAAGERCPVCNRGFTK